MNTFSHQVTGTKSFMLFMATTFFTRSKKLTSTVFLAFSEWVFAPIIKSSIFVNHTAGLANPILYKVSLNCYNGNSWVKFFVHGLFISSATARMILSLKSSSFTPNESKCPCQSLSKSGLMSLCLTQTPTSQQHPLPFKSLQFIQCLMPMSLYSAILFTNTSFKSYLSNTIKTIRLMSVAWTKLFNNWGFNGSLFRPTTSKTTLKNTSLKPFSSSPHRKGAEFVLICKKAVIRAIKVLIPKSIPTAVFFSVMSLRINPIQRSVFLAKIFAMFLVARKHVSVKVSKISKPFSINSDASPTITLKTIVGRVKTALLHCTPYMIKPSSRHSMFHSSSVAKVGKIVKQFYTLPVYNFNPSII